MLGVMTISNEAVRPALEAIRDGAPSRVFVAATGAGAGIQRAIWEVPGVSRFFVGAAFPYDALETERFLGFRPERFCDETAAIELATAAFVRAAAAGEGTAVGVGLTAAVASTTSRRGGHRAHAAWIGDAGAAVATIVLPDELGDDARVRHGAVCDALGLAALADAFGASVGEVVFTRCDARARELLFARPLFRRSGGRAPTSDLPSEVVLFPGAFNPPHEGHLGGARWVEREAGRPVVFAITVDPPHKAPLGTADVLRRAAWLRGHDVLFTQGDPLYLDKARRFPGAGFVVGADALVRMLDPKWGPDVPAVVAELGALGARLHVIPRMIEGALVTLEDLRAREDVGDAVRGLDAVHVEGRWDVSSTELRAAARR